MPIYRFGNRESAPHFAPEQIETYTWADSRLNDTFTPDARGNNFMKPRFSSDIAHIKTHSLARRPQADSGERDPEGRIVGVLQHGVDVSEGPQAERPPTAVPHSSGRSFLGKIVQCGLLSRDVLDAFLSGRTDRLAELGSDTQIGQALVQAGLLTQYQMECVLAGSQHGLVLGNYRVLDRLGSGGMGVVFLAEHCLMKRRVAVKVLPVDEDCPSSVKQRFYAEMRVLAELCHPHIVMAYDAGNVVPADRSLPELVYLVMEQVEGGDLEYLVLDKGRCDVATACRYIHQAASGLQAAHDRHLVHRDIKPSNILLTSTGQAKLVDFGLVRQFCSRLTDPRVLLGSLEFMAPEQSHDPSAVGKEADIYSLGATLFWLITGEPPYPVVRYVGAALRSLQQQHPRRLCELRPDVPPQLDRLIAQMMERNPARRPATPLAVMNALTPFLAEQRIPVQTEELMLANRQLQQSLESRSDDVRRAHDALLFTMAKMAESRDGETPGHLRRLQLYTRVLAQQAASEQPWKGIVDDRFLEQLERCVPLHDIGKLALPDNVLLKPGKLTSAERQLVETHTLIGDRILEALGREHGHSLEFLGMARAIVRHHHERYDGRGYPDGLRADAIPSAARIVAVADVYDALRRKRPHKAPMSHCKAIEIIHDSPGQFDPALLEALACCADEWESIYRDVYE